MTRTEEIAIEKRVLREVRNTMSDMRCDYCCCHDHDGLEDRLEDRLRDLDFESKRLTRIQEGSSALRGDKQRNMSDIFVFGSNLAGRHGRGAALYARQNFGARYGVGEGRTGDAYALPTKDANLRTRSLDEIAASIVTFIEYALAHPELTFQVTRVGCGLAGYRDEDIAPLFDLPPPSNCKMPEEWAHLL